MRYRFSVVSLLIVAAAGCAGSHAEEVRDARIQRIEARSEASQERAEERADPRQRAIERGYDARRERVDSANRPGEDAQAKLLELSKERADFRSQMQTRLEKLADRINATQHKLQVMGARAPTQQRDELKTVAEQYQLVEREVTGLANTPDPSWGAKRSDIEQRTDLLDERVSTLADAVGD